MGLSKDIGLTEEEVALLREAHGELFEDLVRVYSTRTICEVLREIYWLSTDKEIREKVKEAIVMAKKMDKRLGKYYLEAHPDSKIRYDDGLYQPNPFLETKRKEQALDEVKK